MPGTSLFLVFFFRRKTSDISGNYWGSGGSVSDYADASATGGDTYGPVAGTYVLRECRDDL